MGVRIKIAATTAELDELFQVRHRIFAREERPLAQVADGRFVDPSRCGAPADDVFDFGPYLPAGAIVGSGSMLVMEEEYRRVPRVTFAMLGMMYYWALCKGLTHIAGVAAPEAEKLFLGSGYKPVCARFYHERTQLQ